MRQSDNIGLARTNFAPDGGDIDVEVGKMCPGELEVNLRGLMRFPGFLRLMGTGYPISPINDEERIKIPRA